MKHVQLVQQGNTVKEGLRWEEMNLCVNWANIVHLRPSIRFSL